MIAQFIIVAVILLCAYLADNKLISNIPDPTPQRIFRVLVWFIAIVLILACYGLISPAAVKL